MKNEGWKTSPRDPLLVIICFVIFQNPNSYTTLSNEPARHRHAISFFALSMAEAATIHPHENPFPATRAQLKHAISIIFTI